MIEIAIPRPMTTPITASEPDIRPRRLRQGAARSKRGVDSAGFAGARVVNGGKSTADA
jgi:hypothetical protein